jgi:hypothetical protein
MLLLSWTKPAINRLLKGRAAASQGLRTKFFDDWQPELDEALQCLPETDIFPHELFRMLMKMSDPDKRKIILVTEQGEPVALAGLRNRWDFWEPVTRWMVPGVLFPIKDGYMARVLPSLGLEIRIAWWRWGVPPQQTRWMRNVVSEPTYSMRCTEAIEEHWHETGHLRNVLTSRKRCSDFEFKVDMPSAAEWTIRNWGEKWCPSYMAEMPDLSERLMVAQYLEKIGRHHTFNLLDIDKPVAGLTFIVHNNCLVSHHTYRDPNYDWHRVLIRLWDLTFSWAKEMKFDEIDMGGSFDHKKKWAQIAGEKWKFDICPDNVIFKNKVDNFVSKFREKFN